MLEAEEGQNTDKGHVHERGHEANCFPRSISVTDFSVLGIDKSMKIYSTVTV